GGTGAERTGPHPERRRPDRGAPFHRRWREVVCIASGPSLTADDCEAVKAWRAQEEGRGVIVTNTTFRLCPWADVLYALDAAWWKQYLREVRQVFTGALVTPQRVPGTHR